MRNNREPAVWAQLAVLCAAQGRTAEAEQALEQALAFELDDAPLLRSLGEALLGVGLWARAEACLRRGLVVSPGEPSLEFLLASALREQHAFDGALREFKKALGTCEADAAGGPDGLAAECRKQLRSLLREQLGRPEEAAAFA